MPTDYRPPIPMATELSDQSIVQRDLGPAQWSGEAVPALAPWELLALDKAAAPIAGKGMDMLSILSGKAMQRFAATPFGQRIARGIQRRMADEFAKRSGDAARWASNEVPNGISSLESGTKQALAQARQPILLNEARGDIGRSVADFGNDFLMVHGTAPGAASLGNNAAIDASKITMADMLGAINSGRTGNIAASTIRKTGTGLDPDTIYSPYGAVLSGGRIQGINPTDAGTTVSSSGVRSEAGSGLNRMDELLSSKNRGFRRGMWDEIAVSDPRASHYYADMRGEFGSPTNITWGKSTAKDFVSSAVEHGKPITGLHKSGLGDIRFVSNSKGYEGVAKVGADEVSLGNHLIKDREVSRLGDMVVSKSRGTRGSEYVEYVYGIGSDANGNFAILPQSNTAVATEEGRKMIANGYVPKARLTKANVSTGDDSRYIHSYLRSIDPGDIEWVKATSITRAK